MRIDLHTHSVCSDGTDTPAQLVVKASRLGLDVIALTDHDSAAGWAEAAAAGERVGVRIVPGIEFSSRRSGSSLHVLGYGIDPKAPALADELEHVRSSRQTRARRMAERLGEDFPVTYDDVLNQADPGATIGRPHLADALIAAGVFGHRDEVFATVLQPSSPYFVGHYAPDVGLAVRIVRAAGGVPVVAHGRAARQRLKLDEDLVAELVDAGLGGLEVDHRDHSDEDKRLLRGWAQRWDLIVTGSSDYHGLGKRNVLGENLTTEQNLDRLEADIAR